jgi:hypothetical protein
MGRHALAILWPAFVMGGVLEMLVFVVVDPLELRWFGGPALGWTAGAIYTVTFLIFWVVVATASALSAWLAALPDESDRARQLADPF